MHVGNKRYFNETELRRIHRLTNLPLLIADIGFGFPHAPYVHTEWHGYKSQSHAAAAYRDYVVRSAQSGFVVGVNKCQIIDRVVKQPQTTLKPGTLDFNFTPHEPFASLVAAANREAAAAAWRLVRT